MSDPLDDFLDGFIVGYRTAHPRTISMPAPFPRPWYHEVYIDDPDTVGIYDGDDFAICTVTTADADSECGRAGYTAEDLAKFIIDKVNG